MVRNKKPLVVDTILPYLSLNSRLDRGGYAKVGMQVNPRSPGGGSAQSALLGCLPVWAPR